MNMSVYFPWLARCRRFLVATFALVILMFGIWGTLPFSLSDQGTAIAALEDDRYDGNIFVVYAGNGSLVPPRLNLRESFDRKLPVILVYYLDDSRDCKQYAFIVSRMQEFYGRAASIIPVSVDGIPDQKRFRRDEPGYYYSGGVPQTVILDKNGKKVFDAQGVLKFEVVDDVLRDLFDLLPRSESVELQQRTYNEFNSELVD
ncbi:MULTISPECIES: thylakoid membrane photosystem I accumulation factor [unclassified Synechocystis]|uniref:thylakoid membrane photosystem I accumulation factor n=1 Tax=unclassified Synechocystis TaxID=2640012 RepID=UPI0004072564|nr:MULTISPECIES: thylakoid membrane photosystem I accumulation factor [unclassified Synechocystis]MCT0254023.1 thylakoid membrane photosystem I accumulation factor [Synechocystis sp. CS-94]